MAELLVVAHKLYEYFAKIRSAQEIIDKYYNTLIATKYLVVTVKKLVQDVSGIDAVTILHDQRETSLLTFCNEVVEIAHNDVDKILKKYKQAHKSKLERVKAFFRGKNKDVEFVFAEAEIKRSIDTVVRAQSSLETALTIAILHNTAAGQHDIRSQIQGLKQQMSADFRKLRESHHENIRRLKDTPIRLKEVSTSPDSVACTDQNISRPELQKSDCGRTAAASPSSSGLRSPDNERNVSNASYAILEQDLFNRYDNKTPQALSIHNQAKWNSVDGDESSSSESGTETPDHYDLEVAFGSGELVHIPAGTGQISIGAATAAPADDPCTRAKVVSLKRPAPESNAKALVKFLQASKGSEKEDKRHQYTPAAIINLFYGPDFRLRDLCQDDSEGENRKEESPVSRLCVKEIIGLGVQELYIARRCKSSCHHVKITLLTGEISLTKLEQYDYLNLAIVASGERQPRLINPCHGLEVSAFELCPKPCTHTLLSNFSGVAKELSPKKWCCDSVLLGAWPRYYKGSDDEDTSNNNGDLRLICENADRALVLASSTVTSQVVESQSACVIM